MNVEHGTIDIYKININYKKYKRPRSLSLIYEICRAGNVFLVFFLILWEDFGKTNRSIGMNILISSRILFHQQPKQLPQLNLVSSSQWKD